jgi:hypothetical protein
VLLEALLTGTLRHFIENPRLVQDDHYFSKAAEGYWPRQITGNV